MDIFWQITLAESLLNVAVFAMAVIAFGLLRLMLARYLPGNPHLSDAAVGGLFGAATSLVLLMPIHMSGGASTGSQTILLALAGLIAGPLAAVVALAISLAAQAGLAVQNGGLDGFGTATLLAATVAGIGFRRILAAGNRKLIIAYYHCPILGVVCAVAGLAALWIFQDRQTMLDTAIHAVLASTLVSTVLGTLLLHETRRHQAEKSLRESEMRLAIQAHELAAARDSAEYANKAKSAFLANMSHELRTPLNAILGFSEIIALETFGPVGVKRYKEYGGDIHSSGRHLLNLINDLLDVAKIEAGKIEIAPQLIDARSVFDVALKLIGTKAREKNQRLVITVLPNAPRLYADERALKQIMLNLVSNAVKYTPDGGKITVVGGPADGGGFQIVCEDNGPGIPREKLDKIFTPFSQVDNRYNRQAGGTGLGLALVRGLAELHGGRVWLESEYGKGTRFYVVLPGEPTNQAADEAAA
jgi:signal transduction histidine kinase